MKKCYLKSSYFVIVCIIIVGLVSGCSSNKDASPNFSGTNTNNNSNSSQAKTYSTSELEKNITSSGAVTDKGTLVTFVKNLNKVPVNLNIEVEFYDANGNIAGSGSKNVTAVNNNTEVAVEIWDTPDSFDNYKIYVDAEQSEYQSYHSKVEITHNNTGKEIAVQVKNNSDDIIDHMNVSVVYYQGDKIVGYDSDFAYDIKSGRSGNFTLNFPYNRSYNKVTFDNYKIFVNEAYSYNW